MSISISTSTNDHDNTNKFTFICKAFYCHTLNLFYFWHYITFPFIAVLFSWCILWIFYNKYNNYKLFIMLHYIDYPKLSDNSHNTPIVTETDMKIILIDHDLDHNDNAAYQTKNQMDMIKRDIDSGKNIETNNNNYNNNCSNNNGRRTMSSTSYRTFSNEYGHIANNNSRQNDDFKDLLLLYSTDSPQASIDHDRKRDTSKSQRFKVIMIESDKCNHVLFDVTAFCVILYFSVSIWFVLGQLNGDFKDNFLIIYWCFIVYQSMLKKVLKYFANKIDYYRICLITRQSGKYDLLMSNISLNYLMEAYMSLYYYSFIKLYVSFDIPSSQLLVLILLSHFITESFETNIKFTKFYYQFTKIIFEQCNYNWQKISLFRNIISDNECTLGEWRTRLTMDMFVRFICSTFLTLAYCILFVCYGKQRLSNDFGINFEKSIKYTLIYGVIDVAHFTLTIIWAKYCWNFDMISIFVRYIQYFLGMTRSNYSYSSTSCCCHYDCCKCDIVLVLLVYASCAQMTFF